MPFLAAAPAPAPTNNQMWTQQPTNGFSAFPQQNAFVPEANFSNVFDSTDNSAGEELLCTLGLPFDDEIYRNGRIFCNYILVWDFTLFSKMTVTEFPYIFYEKKT